jgi:PST family polysaccharide transporter
VRIKELRSEHIATVFTMNAAVTGVAVLALLGAAPFIGSFYGTPEVAWLLPLVAVAFVLGAFSNVQQALLRREMRYREMTTIGTVDLMVSSVTAVFFAFLGFSYWSLVLGDVCGAFVKFVYGVRVVGWHSRIQFDRQAARELSSFAAGSFVRRLLEHLTRNVDNLVVARTLGMTALGFYDKAFSLTNRLYLRITVVGPNVSFRIFSIIQDEPERFRLAYHKVIMTTTLVTYTAFAVLGAMAPQLIVVAFGEQWKPTVLPFQILCFSFAMKTLNQYAVSASEARGWIWSQVWRQIVQVICIVVGVYLASPWGIDGAALAVAGAGLVMFFLTQSMMRAATGLAWADTLRPQVPSFVLSGLLGVSLVTVNYALVAWAPPHLILLAQAFAAGLIVLAFAWWCPFRDVRVIMHDTVGDLSPRIARWIWKDVAAEQRAEKDRRRGESRGARTVANTSNVAP